MCILGISILSSSSQHCLDSGMDSAARTAPSPEHRRIRAEPSQRSQGRAKQKDLGKAPSQSSQCVSEGTGLGLGHTCSCDNLPTLHLQLLGEPGSPVDPRAGFVLFLAGWKSQESQKSSWKISVFAFLQQRAGESC